MEVWGSRVAIAVVVSIPKCISVVVLLVSCQRPQLQISFWEGRETPPKGVGPHVETCYPVCCWGPAVDHVSIIDEDHSWGICYHYSLMIPSLLTQTGWQDGKCCSACGCTCACKHTNCLQGTKPHLPPTAVPLQWLFWVRTKKSTEDQHPLCIQTCLQALGPYQKIRWLEW